jgi:hypothetical protein
MLLGVEYFRQQARTYRRLFRLATDPEFKQAMKAKAEEYKARAEEIRRDTDAFLNTPANEKTNIG